MKNLTTRFLSAALAVALALPALSAARAADAPPSPTDKKMNDLFPDTVVARGQGFEVRRSQVEEEILAAKASMAARNQQFPEAQRALIESNLVDKLVIKALLLSRATPADRAAGREKAEKIIAQNRTNAPSEEIFAQQVKAETGGLTVNQFVARLSEQAAEEEVVDRELRSTLKITDADVHKFYDTNTNASEQPEMVRASHILISTSDPMSRTPQPLPPEKKREKEELAKKIRARAAAGEDFAKLAREYSDDPGSKNNGGEYTFGRGRMVREFETAAFSMKTNQVSDLVETQFGYHIIKLLEKIPAKKIEFEKIAPKIKEYLSSQQLNAAFPAFSEKLKKEAKTEYFGMNSSVKPLLPAAATPGK